MATLLTNSLFPHFGPPWSSLSDGSLPGNYGASMTRVVVKELVDEVERLVEVDVAMGSGRPGRGGLTKPARWGNSVPYSSNIVRLRQDAVLLE